jgi:glycosyltransferase involved in cell wall biosynthesis
MAAGVPVISTNAGGLGEIMVEGVTGYMGEIGDVETMSEQAISILQDDERLQKFKEDAAAHAMKFDIHNIVPKYEQLYDNVLSKEYLTDATRIAG